MTITEELPNTTMRAAETLKKRALVHDDIDLEKHSNMEATKCSVWEDLTGLVSISIVVMSIQRMICKISSTWQVTIRSKERFSK